MIVKWNKERILVVPASAKINGGSFRLLPGVNDIPDEQFEAARGSLTQHIKAKNIVLVEKEKEVKVKKNGSEVKEKKNVAIPFEELDPEKCLEIISQTNDLDTIKSWRKKEKREEVRLALVQRDEELKKAFAPTEDQQKGK